MTIFKLLSVNIFLVCKHLKTKVKLLYASSELGFNVYACYYHKVPSEEIWLNDYNLWIC